MKVLIIGSGGREHALGWKLAQSSRVKNVMYVGGNGGTATENKSLGNFKALTFRNIYKLIIDHHVDLVIPGSENILHSGIVDFLEKRGYTNIFGPTSNAAQIETDKFFSYKLMAELNIPQAKSIMCHDRAEILHAITTIGMYSNGVVLKARGLAGGKGVLVCDSVAYALSKIDEFISEYGGQILVAERLYGKEFSVFVVSDGENITPFPFLIQDYKRLEDNDKGPNTGGMGSHTTMVDYPNVINEVAQDIMKPLIHKMKNIGYEYKGFLYAGMLLLPYNELRVLEFNCRFGDPECQIAMPMLNGDFFEIIQDTLQGITPTIKQRSGEACCVVLAAKGYPKPTLKLGQPINIPKEVNCKIFHGGTILKKNLLQISKGRVLNVVSFAKDLPTARSNVYDQICRMDYNNPEIFHFRTDIGEK